MAAYSRNQLAIVALLGIFLIPLGLSSLRGLTHVLTCEEEVATTFTVNLDGEVPVVLSATRLTTDQATLLCRALDIDVAAAAVDDRQVELTFVVTNDTETRWNGTVALDLSDAGLTETLSLPITIGSVAAGSTSTETVLVRIREGTYEFSGTLLVGP